MTSSNWQEAYLTTCIKHFSSSALQIDDKSVLSDTEVCGVWRAVSGYDGGKTGLNMS